MLKKYLITGAFVAPLLVAAPACAADGDAVWFVRPGVTALDLANDVESLTLGGAEVPGVGMQTDTHFTPTAQVGRFIGDHFAVSATLGLPPHIEAQGSGSLQPFGKLAELTYGPMTLTGQFRPIRSGPVQPWIGAGLAYMIVFSTEDAAFQDVEIDNDLSPAVEVGADIMVAPNWGFFVEAKRAWLRTEARGTFAGAPVVADIHLDPWAFSGGLTFRF
ncbi:MAG: OmpW/AlkL family protein [Allosphingosinicella sp.]